MNILVTGCNGFIAREYIKQYYTKHNFVGVDTVKHKNECYCIAEYIEDIRNYAKLEEIIRCHNIKCIIHTAAEKSLIRCENNIALAREINFTATIELAALAEKYSAKFVFISSDQVFDGSQAYSEETDPTNPINYYGKLKTMAEAHLVNHNNCAICRTALVFGDIPEEQQQYFSEIKSSDTLKVQGFIVQHVKYALENKQEIILPYDEFVSPTHVSLLAQQIDSVISNDVTGILHCCGKDRISRYDMGVCIANLYGLDKRFIRYEKGTDPLRPKDVSLNCERTEEKLHMSFLSFEEMLSRYVIKV